MFDNVIKKSRHQQLATSPVAIRCWRSREYRGDFCPRWGPFVRADGPEGKIDDPRAVQAPLRAAGITPRLNSVTDQVSEIVRSVEKTLVEELKIGIDASEWFLGEPAGEPGVTREHSLAFSRVGTAGYRINVSIVTVRDAPKEGSEPAPSRRQSEERILWQSCTRELKLKAFEKLPALLDSIVKSAEALLHTADNTAARIKDMLGDVEFVPPPREDPGKRPLFGRSPLFDNIIKGAEGLIQTADETAAKIKDIFGDSEAPPPPRQESRRRSRFSRAPAGLTRFKTRCVLTASTSSTKGSPKPHSIRCLPTAGSKPARPNSSATAGAAPSAAASCSSTRKALPKSSSQVASQRPSRSKTSDAPTSPGPRARRPGVLCPSGP